MNARPDSFGARVELATPSGPLHIYRLDRIASRFGISLERLPFSIRILLEAALRTCDGYQVTEADVERIARWTPQPADQEVPFKPARVILQDFTGVPCVVDLAAMRDAMKKLGGDPKRINPLVPVDLVIDHSVQVDVFGNVIALERNAEIEFERNRERYEFLRWGQKAFSNFRVVPPATGIVHQVNLEFLAQGVLTAPFDGGRIAYPDTLVGTDSHTTMINGLGVLGWGVGGIEAEAVMLGQPLYLVLPQVVGFRLTGSLRDGVTATDLVLTVTQMLRKKGVVDKFVEFCGPGLSTMSLPDRATISNMSPEFGATCAFFPVDDEAIRYFQRTGRDAAAKLVETYCKSQGLYRTDATIEPSFSDTLALDLGDVEPSLAGPKRPQDRVTLKTMKSAFQKSLTAPVKDRGYGLAESEVAREATVGNGVPSKLGHGAVVIAAITSCTNTSNPSVMVGAGLLAKKAAERGLQVKPYVKTSMAPGSKVVTEYLRQGGLLAHLEALGFNVVGYGCTTCIAAGTPVLMADGTARRIEDLPEAGFIRLLGPGDDRRLALAMQTQMLEQGPRECVTLVLQDGRKLVCTPDHELMRADGRWVRADALILESDRVVVGLEAPLDTPGADETGYVLDLGELVFAMDRGERRLQTLAFARLLGHLISGGSPAAGSQGRMNVGNAIDGEGVLDDVERITGQRPHGARYDKGKWSIPLPYELTATIAAIAGADVGQRVDQPPTLPAFVLDPRCPKAVVREFLGGLFGAAGGAPILHRQGLGGHDVALGNPTYSQTSKPEQVPQLRDLMAEIVRLLGRCGASTQGFHLYEYAAASVDAPRTEVRLVLPDGLSFVENVGYRYSVDKTLRASAAAVYWRTVNNVHEQKLWMRERTNARTTDKDEMDFWDAGEDLTTEVVEPWVSPETLYQEIGADFELEHDAVTLPTMALRVIERRPAGQRQVYDLTVDDVHAFVAGTVAVHNCIGNSGPLPEDISQAITDNKLVAAAVLSGNRNFEGRVNPHTRANYLASPPLVVAYALAGTVDIDMETEPLGKDREGKPVFLRDLWPSQKEISDTVAHSLQPAMFNKSYGNVFDGNPKWNAIPVGEGELYPWDEASTYIHEPPFFQGLTPLPAPVADIQRARVLVMVGDSVTTDHISPAGDIAEKSPAGEWLKWRSIQKKDFNSYGSRRGNDLVMVRGTFANIRLKNLLLPGTEGNVTVHLPSGEQMSVFDASQRYMEAGTPLLVLAGKEYGSGSSRDWAAKGTLLLGVKAVLAESYERIHRSNLVGMGVLPLQYEEGQSAESLGLTGRETFSVTGMAAELSPRQRVSVEAAREDGSKLCFHALARLDTPVEVDYYRNGGILPAVLRGMAKTAK